MSLLDSTTPAPTNEQLAFEQLLQPALSAFNNLVAIYNNGMAIVWEGGGSGNLNGLSPQQVLTALGTQAGDFVSAAYETMNLINTIQPDTVSGVPAGNSLTINEDGTVTVVTE